MSSLMDKKHDCPRCACEEGTLGTVLGILCNVRDAAGDGLEDVDLDYIARQADRAVELLKPVALVEVPATTSQKGEQR
jgi:hypothetical protein